MKYKNRILNEQISKWTAAAPDSYIDFYNYRTIIKIADELSEVFNFSEKDLARIVDGIFFLNLSLKKDSRNSELYNRTAYSHLMLLFDPLIKQLNSDSYKEYIIREQITEEDILEINNMIIKINAKAIILHAKRTSKALITTKDVETVQKSLVRYNKEFYSEPIDDSKLRFSTKLDQIRMKAIHQYLYDEGYIEFDEASWLYWFDLQPWLNKKKNPSKIQWNKASYILSNIIYIICGNMEVRTETVMKNAFSLRKGKQFQKKTIFVRTKIPYKNIYEKIEMAHHSIK